jgi:hypothetical protein
MLVNTFKTWDIKLKPLNLRNPVVCETDLLQDGEDRSSLQTMFMVSVETIFCDIKIERRDRDISKIVETVDY